MKATHYLYIAMAAAALAAAPTQSVTAQEATTEETAQATELMGRIYDNEVYQRNIVSRITFSLNKGQGNVSVPGQLRMRRDEIIRIQLQMPLLGSELGRLEFTPTGVLFLDRIHKQYCRASYDDVPFLADNGISFYTLQALFWNKLTLPGEQAVGYTDLERFTVGTASAATTPVSVENGKLAFRWNADTASGLLRQAVVSYEGGSHGTSTLTWTYDDFRTFGSKQFPHSQTLAVSTAATGRQKNLQVTLALDGATADDGWDTNTNISDRYTEVSATELLSKLITL